MLLLLCRKLLQNQLKRLEKAGKLIKVKASYKLGDELKKGPKKAKPAAKKSAAKPKAAEKKAAVKPKASTPKKVAADKKGTGQQSRSAQGMLCLQSEQLAASCSVSHQDLLSGTYGILCVACLRFAGLFAVAFGQHLTGCLRCQKSKQVSCQEGQ